MNSSAFDDEDGFLPIPLERFYSAAASPFCETDLSNNLGRWLPGADGNSNVAREIHLALAEDAHNIHYDAAYPTPSPNPVLQDEQHDHATIRAYYPNEDALTVNGQGYASPPEANQYVRGNDMWSIRTGDGICFTDTDAQCRPNTPALVAGLADLRPGDLVAPPASLTLSSSQSQSSHLEDIPQSPPISTTRAEMFPCQSPGCNVKAFRRAVDRKRHMEAIHSRGPSPSLACDYLSCARHHNPCSRKDHLRDHLRGYHYEDLPRRGQVEDAAWWSSRADTVTHEGWWRCRRCLARVTVQTDRFVCPHCRIACETQRMTARTARPETRDREGCAGELGEVLPP